MGHHLIGSCRHHLKEEPNWTTQQKWDKVDCLLQHIAFLKIKDISKEKMEVLGQLPGSPPSNIKYLSDRDL